MKAHLHLGWRHDSLLKKNASKKLRRLSVSEQSLAWKEACSCVDMREGVCARALVCACVCLCACVCAC